MSGIDVKKPETREELLKIFTEAAKKAADYSNCEEGKTDSFWNSKDVKHSQRHALYMAERIQRRLQRSSRSNADNNSEEMREEAGPVYLIGESLVGEGNEVAHVDLMIGDKQGPVGQAFATGLTSLSAGHTPLLAVIRPNLPPKPHTLIVPK